ncbi:ABC transporter permease [Pseudonocardia halophobica]|uniref:ABC di/oligopeptide transporter inner membrane subunit n=1 Tax=Pseudonocardia halophobica TaxID=29401 RepID=A0A9W6KYY2_9PSEU|nr:ABC transporter permease [Pseudonocardia halophobica]GLL10576.1 ABC di/oligopeptide transporter inner membrane subunit [Pseudonocardia halophobica]
MPVQFILRRLISVIPVLFIVSIGVFSLTYLIPGDAAVTLAGDTATPERIEQIRQELGLDRPMLVQYFSWLGGVLQGNLGTSIYANQSVGDELLRRFPVTFSLAVGAMLFTLIFGIAAGVLAARKPNSWVDRLVQAGSSVGIAMPSFWIALILVLIFAVNLGWLPAVGYVAPTVSFVGWLKSIILPSIALGVGGASVVARQLRGSLMDVLTLDYVRTAKARGISPRAIVLKHALKNAMVPVLTVLGVQAAYLLGGTVIVEQIFGIPGVGKYVYDSLFTLDLPVVQGSVIFIALLVILVNLLVDISYGLVNPKARQT